MATRKILGVISKQRTERLLEDWANTREDGVRRLLRIHAEEIDIPKPEFKQTVRSRGFKPTMMPSTWTLVERPDGTLVERPEGPYVEDWTLVECAEVLFVEDTVRRIAEFLRKAWDAPDQRRFDWYLWKALSIAQTVWQLFEFVDDPPERASAVEAAIFYLRHSRRRALHCANPNCTTPYFFQQGKRQRFCSTICALPTQRESKRKWWAKKHPPKEKKK